MSAKLITFTPNYMDVIAQAAGQCYEKNVGAKGIERIIQSGHLSVLEHCNAVFEVECSVRVLGQITRHRHLGFTVKSTRGATFGFSDIIIPSYFENNTYLKQDFIDCQVDSIEKYLAMIRDGVPLEVAAYILPQGIRTKMVVSGNFRAWYEYLPKRECKRALPEHRQLAKDIHFELSKNIPEIFHRELLNCHNCEEDSCEYGK